MKFQYWWRKLGYGIFAGIIAIAFGVVFNVLILGMGMNLRIGESLVAGLFMIPPALLLLYAMINIPICTLMLLFYCFFDDE